ncbi:MAG: hypothetical protein IJA99_04180 [Oscillospiraceae bacterium]|nr:hypothetical protein [Oscillospiraceae bacterium]
MRKMLSLLLALLMTVTVVPVEAFAADLPTDFDITNDSEFEDLKDYLAAGENNYASGTEITVIGSRTIADESGVELAIPVGVTVNWQANLTVSESGDPRIFPGLIIDGAGVLRIAGSVENNDSTTESHGVYLKDDCSTFLWVYGTVSANGGSAIYSDGSYDIQIDGGTVTSNGSGIYSAKLSSAANIYLRNDAKIETKGCAIQSRMGQISIENSTVTASTSSYVIDTNGNLSITDDARIVNTGSGQALFMGKSIHASASDPAPTLTIDDTIPGNLHLVLKGGASIEGVSVKWSLQDFFARSSDTAIFETVSDDTRWIPMLTGEYFELITDAGHMPGSYEYKNDTHHTYSMACADTACINYYNENSGDQEHVFNANDECPTCGVQFYDLYVDGIHVNERNAANVLGDGKVSYDAATNQLSLNGAVVSSADAPWIDGGAPQRQGIAWLGSEALTVELTGENKITHSSSTDCGIASGADLTFTGTGGLDFDGTMTCGIAAYYTVTVNGPSIKMDNSPSDAYQSSFVLQKGHVLLTAQNGDEFNDMNSVPLTRRSETADFGPFVSDTSTYFEAMTADHPSFNPATDMIICPDSCIIGTYSKNAAVSLTYKGDTSYYGDLASAISAAKDKATSQTDPATVKVLKDLTLAAGESHWVTGHVIFDLNGNTVKTAAGSITTPFIVGRSSSFGHFTVTDTSAEKDGVLESGGNVIEGQYGSLTVFDGTVRSVKDSYATAISASEGFIVNVKGGKVESGNIAISGQYVNVSGGEVSSDEDGILTAGDGGMIEVSGGKVSGGEYGIYTQSQFSNIIVSGGTVEGDYGIFAQNESKVRITGGTVSSTDSNNPGIYLKEDSELTVIDGVIRSANYAAVEATNSKITVSGGKVSGSDYGIRTAGASEVTVSGGEISASANGSYGLSVEGATKMTLSGGKITGSDTGIYLYQGRIITVSADLADAVAQNGPYTFGVADYLYLTGQVRTVAQAASGVTLEKGWFTSANAGEYLHLIATDHEDPAQAGSGEAKYLLLLYCEHIDAYGDSTVDENTGICSLCQTQFAAQVRQGAGAYVYYSDMDSALTALQTALDSEEATIRLYADLDKALVTTGSHTLIVSLNGHKITASAADEAALSHEGRLALRDGGEITGGKYGIKTGGVLELSSSATISGTDADVALMGETSHITPWNGSPIKIYLEQYPAVGESRKIARAFSAGTDLASRLSVDKGGYLITGDAQKWEYFLHHPLSGFTVQYGTMPLTAGTDGKYSVIYNGSSLSVLPEPASGADASLFTTVWDDGTGAMSFAPEQPGTYTFAIKMNGETVAEGEVTIKKLSASNILWNGYETEKYWDGKAIPTPDVDFRFPNGTGADPDAVYWQKDGESEWHNFADGSVPSDAGTYHVKAEYSGSSIHNGAFERKTYIIHPNELAGVTLSAEEGVYTGNAQDPTRVVTTVHDLDFALVEGTHYTVSVTKDGQPVSEIKNGGSYQITVTSATGNITGSVTAAYTVKKADLSALSADASDIFYGQKLSDSTLSGAVARENSSDTVTGSWSWKAPDTQPAASGDYEAVFTPDDTESYNTLTLQVPLIVNKATPKLIVGIDDSNAVPGGEILLTALDILNPYDESLLVRGAYTLYWKVGDTGPSGIMSPRLPIPQSFPVGTVVNFILDYSGDDNHAAGEIKISTTIKACTHPATTLVVGTDEHWEECGTCGAELNREVHSPASDELFHDDDQHWHLCECGAKVEVTGHSAASDEYYRSGDYHWHKCECGVNVEMTTHSPASDEWKHDKDLHWQTCVCGAAVNEEEHIPGDRATATKPQICTVCERVLKKAGGLGGGSDEETGWYDEDGDFVVYPSRKPGSKPSDDKENPATGAEPAQANRTTSSSAAACNARYPSCHAYLETGAGAAFLLGKRKKR